MGLRVGGGAGGVEQPETLLLVLLVLGETPDPGAASTVGNPVGSVANEQRTQESLGVRDVNRLFCCVWKWIFMTCRSEGRGGGGGSVCKYLAGKGGGMCTTPLPTAPGVRNARTRLPAVDTSNYLLRGGCFISDTRGHTTTHPCATTNTPP